jgi:hypothetical protein
MAVTLRSGLNRQLTHAEMDENFRPLAEAFNSSAQVERGFWPDQETTQIWRLRDRVFIGDAADATGNRNGTQGTWPLDGSTGDGANWIPRDTTLLATSSRGLIAIAGMSRVSDKTVSPPTECIGVAGHVLADGSTSAHALYGDAIWESGSVIFGLEVAVKNRNTDVTCDAYSTSTGGGAIGLHIGTGDDAYGGVATANCTAAVNITGGASGNATTWNRGIRVVANSLTRDGNNRAYAMTMGQKTALEWMVSTGESAAYIRSDNATTGTTTHLVFEAGALSYYDVAEKRIFRASAASSGVNNFRILNAATTSYPQLSAEGDDTNIGMFFVAKGSAPFRFMTSGGLTKEELRVGGNVVDPVNFIHIYGQASTGPPVILAAGSDTNIDVRIMGKGTGGARLDDGAGAAKVRVNTTGIGFFATTPVAKQTIGAALSEAGAETNTNLATRINEIRTALINYGLAA